MNILIIIGLLLITIALVKGYECFKRTLRYHRLHKIMNACYGYNIYSKMQTKTHIERAFKLRGFEVSAVEYGTGAIMIIGPDIEDNDLFFDFMSCYTDVTAKMPCGIKVYLKSAKYHSVDETTQGIKNVGKVLKDWNSFTGYQSEQDQISETLNRR